MDNSGVIAIAGVVGTLLSPVITRVLDERSFARRMLAKRVETAEERDHKATLDGREKARARYDEKLRTYVDVFAADDRLIYLGGVTREPIPWGELLTEAARPFHIARLIGPAEVAQPLMTMFARQVSIVFAGWRSAPKEELEALQSEHAEALRTVARIFQEDLDSLGREAGIEDRKNLSALAESNANSVTTGVASAAARASSP